MNFVFIFDPYKPLSPEFALPAMGPFLTANDRLFPII